MNNEMNNDIFSEEPELSEIPFLPELPEILPSINEIIIPNMEEREQEQEQEQRQQTNNNKELFLEVKRKMREKQKQQLKYKKLTSNKKKKLIRDIKSITDYIQLITGEELCFDESENNSYPLLLPTYIIADELIRNILRRIPYSPKKRIEYLGKFRLPEKRADSNYIYHEVIRDSIYENYYKEYKLRFLFRILLQKWRIHKLDAEYTEIPDPITLQEPDKPITIYDWKANKKFVFDAKSLSNSINSDLLYYENGFAIPHSPKNLITNLPFTYPELVSIYYQLKNTGESKWAFSSLKELNFNKPRWELYNKQQLFYNAIRNEIIKLDSYDGRELFIDFIVSRLEQYELNPSDFIIRAYEKGVIYMSNHYYIQSLKPIILLHYEAQYFKINKELAIKTAFLKLYKNQSKFIKDMIKNGYL